MAVVKVKQVKSTLGKAVKYITNPAKTNNYELVSTSTGKPADDPNGIADVYLHDLDRSPMAGRKQGRVLAHHIIQSFDPTDDITPKQAHELGLQFIHDVFGNEYDYTIATHTDRHHIHNHILLCPNSHITHRNIRIQRNALGRWRAASDRLCRENGLKTIRATQTKRLSPQIGELHISAKGESVKDAVRTAIDRACQESKDFKEFCSLLAGMGVRVDVRGRHLVYAVDEPKRRFRDVKLGVDYNEMSVMSKIGRRTMDMVSFDRSLVAGQVAGAVQVWLPGSHRKLKITIPDNQIIKDGRTWRAYLAADTKQVLTDPNGDYTRTVPCDGLYEWFARPSISIADYARGKLGPDDFGGLSKRAIMQARQLDGLQRSLDELHALSRSMGQGSTRSESLAILTDKVSRNAARMQALVAAIAEAADRGEPTEALEGELDLVRHETESAATEAEALKRVLERDKEKQQRNQDVRPNKRRKQGKVRLCGNVPPIGSKEAAWQ